MRGIAAALRQRGLKPLLGAGLISATGDWALRVGLAYHVYVLTGSTVASALMLLASFVPQILLGSVAGVFVDRWDPRRTMILCEVALGLGLLPLLLVHHAGQAWVVYTVLIWEGAVQQFFSPAEQAMLPRLSDDEHLPTANALAGQSRDVSRLIGSAIGGALTAAGGISALAVVDLGSFLLSAALIARTPHGAQQRLEAATVVGLRGRLADLGREWGDGIRLCTSNRVLRTILLFLLITSLGEGIMGTLFAPFARSVLHGTSAEYGLIVSAQAVGGIAGGMFAAALGNRLNAARALGCAAIAFGAIDLALFLYPLAWTAVWPAAVLIAVAGVPGAFILVSGITLLQRNAGDGHIGRVFGALGVVEGVAVVVGTLTAGLLAQTLGIVPVLVTQGAGYVAAGYVALVALRVTPDREEFRHDAVWPVEATSRRKDPAREARRGTPAAAGGGSAHPGARP
jgi:Na+/melibiose symporter-like transporter